MEEQSRVCSPELGGWWESRPHEHGKGGRSYEASLVSEVIGLKIRFILLPSLQCGWVPGCACAHAWTNQPWCP